MALTECPECGASFPEGALACPECGATRLDRPERPGFSEQFGPMLMVFVVVLVLLLVLLSLAF